MLPGQRFGCGDTVMTAILSSLLLWGLAHLLPMLGRKSLPPPMLDNINIFASVLVVVFLLWAVLTPWVAMGILIAASLTLPSSP